MKDENGLGRIHVAVSSISLRSDCRRYVVVLLSLEAKALSPLQLYHDGVHLIVLAQALYPATVMHRHEH